MGGVSWTECSFRAMGSRADLLVAGADPPLVEWAVAELERLEQCWSRFRPDSELSRLNREPGRWVTVSDDLLRILGEARRLWELTAGAFDPTVLPALERLGYDRTFDQVPRRGPDTGPSNPAAGFSTVDIDPDRRAVRLPPGAALDLGGLGKGLAADLVAEGLIDRGAASALVALGGDIRTAGVTPPGGWRIPVLDPFDASRVWREVSLIGDAIVTSTSLIRRWERGGAALHHIIDPLTGAPADTPVVAAVVLADRACRAEGLAKAAMVLGADAAPVLLDGTGAVGTLFLDGGGTVEVGAGALACPAT